MRNQTSTPVLGKIPYIGRLFSTLSYGKESEHLLVMVTPRVIVLSEKEESAPAEVKPTIATEVLPKPRPTVPHASSAPANREPANDSGQLPPGWVAFRGRVRLAGRAVEGARTYVVEMEERGYVRPVAYLTAGPGIDLGSQVGKVVEVCGPTVYRGDIRTNYMTVMRVFP